MRTAAWPASLLALSLGSLLTTSGCRAGDAPDPGVTIGHRFTPGEVRRYRGLQSVQVQELVRGEQGALEPTGALKRQEWTFVEEEACHGELAPDVFDVSYHGVSMALKSYRGDELIYEYSPETSSWGDVGLPGNGAAGSLPWSSDPIRYRITGGRTILDVELPGSILQQHGPEVDVEDLYRRGLQARYQSCFPSEPVRPGDTWGGAIPVASGLWSMGHTLAPDYELSVRHAGFEELDGVHCVALEFELSLGSEEQETVVSRSTWDEFLVRGFTAHSRILFAVEEGYPLLEKTEIEAVLVRRTLGDNPKEHLERQRQSITTTCIETRRSI